MGKISLIKEKCLWKKERQRKRKKKTKERKRAEKKEKSQEGKKRERKKQKRKKGRGTKRFKQLIINSTYQNDSSNYNVDSELINILLLGYSPLNSQQHY